MKEADKTQNRNRDQDWYDNNEGRDWKRNPEKDPDGAQQDLGGIPNSDEGNPNDPERYTPDDSSSSRSATGSENDTALAQGGYEGSIFRQGNYQDGYTTTDYDLNRGHQGLVDEELVEEKLEPDSSKAEKSRPTSSQGSTGSKSGSAEEEAVENARSDQRVWDDQAKDKTIPPDEYHESPEQKEPENKHDNERDYIRSGKGWYDTDENYPGRNKTHGR